VGSVVVEEIVGGWAIYRDHTPPLTPCASTTAWVWTYFTGVSTTGKDNFH
jgi:hypothetical protein